MKAPFITTLSIIMAYVALSSASLAQTLKPHQIGLELGGNLIFYGVYYQYNIPLENKHYCSLKLGLTPWLPVYRSAFTGQVDMTLDEKNRWSIGMGYSIIREKFDENSTKANSETVQILSPQINYQVVTKNQVNFWRFGLLSPIQLGNPSTKIVVNVWPTIGFGWIFE